MDTSVYSISSSASIREALAAISSNSIGMIFIVGDKEKVIGVATDGDIRSSLLDGSKLSDQITSACNREFIWRSDSDSRESILKLLDSRIKAIPILNKDLQLVDVVTSSQFPLVVERGIYSRARAPVRVSFAGGGSDLTHFFVKEGGAVINATISLYCQVTLRLRQDKKITIDSLDLDKKISYSNFSDLVQSKDDFDLFRSLIKLIKPDFGFDLSVSSDFPEGSGLGGSSAVMIAVCGCFNEFRRDKWDDFELAEMAFQAERLDMGISGGWQDQYATVFGGFNFIEFRDDNNLIHPLRLGDRTILELQANLVLFKISSGRNSGSIHDDQKTKMQSEKIRELVSKNVEHSYHMRENLLRGRLNKFGEGLNTAWEFKRQLSNKISSDYIDDIYNYAIGNGAIGGKLLGAGGGGFFMFYVEVFKRNSFLKAMSEKGLLHTNFNFDSNGMKSWTVRDIK